MTAAVCMKCGEMKLGAFTPCFKCGLTPESPEDQARAILLSDHNVDRATLEQIGKKIADGVQPSFD